jgi:hypothetical protein
MAAAHAAARRQEQFVPLVHFAAKIRDPISR